MLHSMQKNEAFQQCSLQTNTLCVTDTNVTQQRQTSINQPKDAARQNNHKNNGRFKSTDRNIDSLVDLL